MSLSYSIREGLAGFRRAKFAAIAATSAMTVALVLIGLFALVVFEGQEASEWLRQQVGELRVFLVEDTDDAAAETLQTRAALLPGVEETEYISPAEAQEIFAEEFGEGAEAFYDEPFLQGEINVRVRSAYANPDSLSAIAAEIETWNRVDEAIFNQPLLSRVQQNLRLVGIVGGSLGALVVLAALFLVANTIRLTVYARRLLIRTMKLVGATDSFIRKPFLVEGIAQGVIAGVLAGALLWGLVEIARNYLPALTLVGMGTGLVLMLSLVVLGALLGWIGSFLAVRRFIKQVALH